MRAPSARTAGRVIARSGLAELDRTIRGPRPSDALKRVPYHTDWGDLTSGQVPGHGDPQAGLDRWDAVWSGPPQRPGGSR